MASQPPKIMAVIEREKTPKDRGDTPAVPAHGPCRESIQSCQKPIGEIPAPVSDAMGGGRCGAALLPILVSQLLSLKHTERSTKIFTDEVVERAG